MTTDQTAATARPKIPDAPSATHRAQRTVDDWRQRTEVPLMAAAALFLAAYAWPILDPSIADGWSMACEVVTWATWALFAIDYGVRLIVAESRRRFFVHHLHDLAVVLLPLLRPLRLLRLVTLLAVLNRSAGVSLRGRVAVYITGATGLLIFVAALAVLDAERASPDASITSFGDALWWGIVTTTTVGYGDAYPVTGTGRLVAAGLMVAGIALLGTVTALLASWLVEQIQAGQRTTQSDVERLTSEVRALREAIGRQPAVIADWPSEARETPNTAQDQR